MGEKEVKESYWYPKDRQWDVEDNSEKDTNGKGQIEEGVVEELDNFHIQIQGKVQIQGKINLVSTCLGITICFILIFPFLWGAYKGDWTPLANMKNVINLVISRLLRL